MGSFKLNPNLLKRSRFELFPKKKNKKEVKQKYLHETEVYSKVHIVQRFFVMKDLEEKSKNLSSQMLPSGFFMIHNSTTCCQYDISKKNKKIL